MIGVAPYDPLAAMAVLRDMDPSDRLEVEAARGLRLSHLDLFAEWHGGQPGLALSHVLKADSGTPFALLIVAHSPGFAGVAQAALLARSHWRWRVQLARAAVHIRQEMPGWAKDHGLHRIEARCWADHPTAPRFLAGCGFTQEARMPGFGRGRADFLQFAWT